MNKRMKLNESTSHPMKVLLAQEVKDSGRMLHLKPKDTTSYHQSRNKRQLLVDTINAVQCLLDENLEQPKEKTEKDRAKYLL